MPWKESLADLVDLGNTKSSQNRQKQLKLDFNLRLNRQDGDLVVADEKDYGKMSGDIHFLSRIFRAVIALPRQTIQEIKTALIGRNRQRG